MFNSPCGKHHSGKNICKAETCTHTSIAILKGIEKSSKICLMSYPSPTAYLETYITEIRVQIRGIICYSKINLTFLWAIATGYTVLHHMNRIQMLVLHHSRLDFNQSHSPLAEAKIVQTLGDVDVMRRKAPSNNICNTQHKKFACNRKADCQVLPNIVTKNNYNYHAL